MTRVIYRTQGSEAIEVSGETGVSLMELAVASGISGIEGECGGQAMCATCHVYVDPAWIDRLPERSDAEDALLDCVETERRPNSRLCCQILLSDATDGIVVEVPCDQ